MALARRVRESKEQRNRLTRFIMVKLSYEAGLISIGRAVELLRDMDLDVGIVNVREMLWEQDRWGLMDDLDDYFITTKEEDEVLHGGQTTESGTETED